MSSLNSQFQGISNGFHGPIKVTLTIEEDKIVDITSDHHPQAHVGNLGIQQMIESIKTSHSLKVDAVSGATLSTNAFKDAALKAFQVSQGTMTIEDALDANIHNSIESFSVDTISGASQSVNLEAENTSIARPSIIESLVKFKHTFDVIVVGSGGAGMSAATEASQHNLSVLICEKAGIPGGTTNLSGGVLQAAGTKYQRDLTKYKNDTPENHAKLWIKAGENLLDESLVKDLAHGAPENVEWLSNIGIKWNALYGHCHIPYVEDEYHADRIHQYEGGGAGGQGTILIQTLLKEALNNGAKIQYNCPVTHLVTSDDRNIIVGVGVQIDDKIEYYKARRGVVLATASVDHNPALAKALNPQQYNDLLFGTVLSASTDTGDGIIMGIEVGAAISGMGGCIDFDGRTGNATNNQIPTIPMIIVNGIGKRFVCEDAT